MWEQEEYSFYVFAVQSWNEVFPFQFKKEIRMESCSRGWGQLTPSLYFVDDVQLKEKMDNHGLNQGTLVLSLCDHKVVLTPERTFGSCLLD